MKRFQLSFLCGLLAPFVYLLFTVLAYLRYPSPYSPTSNWLSDLGNPEVNPLGALFYNTGIVLTALLLMGFFAGLAAWKVEDKRPQVIMLRLTQVSGIAGAFRMLMSGFFPINSFSIHSFWSTSLYILLSTSFVFSAAMLRYRPEVPRWLLGLGILTAVVVITTSFLQSLYVLEWITVLLFLCFVTILGIETKRHTFRVVPTN